MIYDCRRKEILLIKRIGGDLELSFKDLNGRVLYKDWFKMKRPYKRTYQRIERKFQEIKSLLERQDKE